MPVRRTLQRRPSKTRMNLACCRRRLPRLTGTCHISTLLCTSPLIPRRTVCAKACGMLSCAPLVLVCCLAVSGCARVRRAQPWPRSQQREITLHAALRPPTTNIIHHHCRHHHTHLSTCPAHPLSPLSHRPQRSSAAHSARIESTDSRLGGSGPRTPWPGR